MRRQDLIGTWKWVAATLGGETLPIEVPGTTMRLEPDGTAIVETPVKGRRTATETAMWEYVDSKHWQLRLNVPRGPAIPELAQGAVDVSTYEVQSFSRQRMVLVKHDYEFAFVYERTS